MASLQLNCSATKRSYCSDTLNSNFTVVHFTVSYLLSNTKCIVPMQCHGMFVHFFSRSFCLHAFWVTINNLHLINLPLLPHTDFNYTTKLSVCYFKKVKMIGKIQSFITCSFAFFYV